MLQMTRKLHRWLMLFAGLQFLIWAISGVYMVMLNIHYIHGEELLIKQDVPLVTKDIKFDMNELLSQYPDARKVRLGLLVDTPVYRFSVGFNEFMVNAKTGKVITGVSESIARRIAAQSLQNEHQIDSIRLITDNPPSEIGSRTLPLWQVNFVGLSNNTLYVNPRNGEIVSIRHNGWRIFDAAWRLHIMDYYEGADIDNLLLNVFTLTGLLAVLAGLALLYFRLFCNTEEIKHL